MDDLAGTIALSRALIEGKRSDLPPTMLILALARTVVELADHPIPPKPKPMTLTRERRAGLLPDDGSD